MLHMSKDESVSEAGRKGGLASFRKRGRAGYIDMGKRGGDSVLRKYGPEYFKRIRRGEKPSQDEKS